MMKIKKSPSCAATSTAQQWQHVSPATDINSIKLCSEGEQVLEGHRRKRYKPLLVANVIQSLGQDAVICHH